MKFDVISSIKGRRVIAKGTGVKILKYLRKAYGPGVWRKMKGNATIRLPNGAERKAEPTGMKLTGLADASSR